MSDETFCIMRKLDMSGVEIQTSLQCAPLLTGLKMSNLLHVRADQTDEVFQLFEDSPISCHVLYKWKDRVSILLYRKETLRRYLNQDRVSKVMKRFGYCEMKLEAILEILAVRYQAHIEGHEEFPHEIGLLLGYPPEDVTGFIENEGRNFLCSGYWKVYGDANRAKRIFAAYDRSREAVIRMAGNGLGVKDILASYNIMKRRQLIAQV